MRHWLGFSGTDATGEVRDISPVFDENKIEMSTVVLSGLKFVRGGGLIELSCSDDY